MEKRLQQLIAPFILRRSKSEVAPELPPLTEETIYCDMSEEQSESYEQEKNSLRNILLQQPTAHFSRFQRDIRENRANNRNIRYIEK